MKLNCSVVKDIYVLYEENELSEEVKEYVREHLNECAECREIYESGVSLPDAVEEKLPEPSGKFDEKMMLKLKLSRLRITLVLIAVVIGMTVFNLYSESRAYIVRDFQQYDSYLYEYSLQIQDLKNHEKSQGTRNIYNQTAGEMLNKINDSYEQVARNFNILERHGIKDSYSNQCFDLSMSTLVFTLNNRWENGHFSEKDEEVYKRLKSEMSIIAKISNVYVNKLNSKVINLDTKKLKNSFDKLNTLAKVYTKYNKLPEEIKYLTEDELKAKISYILGEQTKNISLTKKQDFNYSFKMVSKDNSPYNGLIDSVTGRISEIGGGRSTLKGDLIEVEEAKEKIKEITLRNLGEGFDVKIEYLGINVNFQTVEGAKKYCFKLQPTFKGYNIFNEYNVTVDARINTIYNYSSMDFSGNAPTAVPGELRADMRYSQQEALKNITTPDINKELLKYKSTNFIKSMFTGEYVLVHYYDEMVDKTKANPRQLYINTDTGKEEWPSYSEGMISY